MHYAIISKLMEHKLLIFCLFNKKNYLKIIHSFGLNRMHHQQKEKIIFKARWKLDPIHFVMYTSIEM